MKILSDLILNCPISSINGNINGSIDKIVTDSRDDCYRAAFIAIPGIKTDGALYINEAIVKGCVAVFLDDSADYNVSKNPTICFVKVKNIKQYVGIIISNFYDNPSAKMKVVAVTGTNGKTSTVHILYQVFSTLGFKCGLVSTIDIKIEKQSFPATMTTPDPLDLQQYFHSMVSYGTEYCFIEASSQSLDQYRLAGTTIYGAIFTNVTNNEHLDYHHTYDKYIACKQTLFNNLSNNAFALYNLDDEHSEEIVAHTKAKKFNYSIHNKNSDFFAKHNLTIDGITISVNDCEFHSHLIGIGNVYNLLVAFSVAKICTSFDTSKICEAMSKVQPIKGRMQIWHSKGIHIVVDYACKPYALELLYNYFRGNNIITVFGCGGERDRSKRPIMTQMAHNNSKLVVITSDNLRNEDFNHIVDDMMDGIHNSNNNIIIEADRKVAIIYALEHACHGDVVLILGKGHEEFQIIRDIKYHHNDIEIVEEWINK